MERPDAQPGQSVQQPLDEAVGSMLVVHAQHLTSGPTSLRLVGVIDYRTATILERRLIDEARNCGIQPARLLLNLEEVTFLDRTGLDTLLHARDRLTRAFVTIELTEPTPYVVRLLHEANLDGASWILRHE